jgi:N-acetylglucosamine-6-phosphate deacetylase
LNLSLTDAVDCATINPARNLGVDDRKGSIELGKDADFVVVDNDLNVYMTICRGKIVYSKI